MVEQVSQNSASVLKPNLEAPDPNVLQARASNPIDSVWVGASAGSGKTKVLTDRILRLLLPDAEGNSETPPHKILALTFTKAGASEMVLRINKKLSSWATLPLTSDDDDNLTSELASLLGGAPSEKQIKAGRRLFAQVIDVPGGLKIMTIHSFCQSLLGRFPIEAGLSPHFVPLEEPETKALLTKARDSILKESAEEKGSPLAQAIYNLAIYKNDTDFFELLEKVTSERRQVEKILTKNFGTDGLYNNLCQALGIVAGETAEDVLLEASKSENFNETILREACGALASVKSKTDQKNSITLQDWLDASVNERVKLFDNYKGIYLKQDDDLKKSCFTKDILTKYPDVADAMLIEAQRVYDTVKKLQAVHVASITRDLFVVAEKVLAEFQTLKEKRSALDFDDLIIKSLDLLEGRTMNMSAADMSPWVRYKLDQGIDHILVDEAQDTNPEQWEIIKYLCDDFYDGAGVAEQERTLFVVGDEKQSIFSFQRASPEKFKVMREWFDAKINAVDKELKKINFITSFRSVPCVLEAVDAVFSTPEMLSGLSDETLKHYAFEKNARKAGRVELWPVFKSPEQEALDYWAPPIREVNSQSGASKMADHIGDTIEAWFDNNEILEGKNRPIEAGDIMILLKSRTAFVDQLVRALKTRDIPVSGVDRMVLSEQLVVQDLCVCASFALLPSDDLSLAELLKSPFIGFTEEQLFEVSYGRKGSLWERLKGFEAYKGIVSWLTALIKHSGSARPYEFFSRILQEQCPAHKKSGLHGIKQRLGAECLDPLDEFLNVTLSYEQSHLATLQIFLQDMLSSKSQIKRQMEESGGAVRIMTVHGAKGLQAPIVILPDTIHKSNSKIDPILWPDRSGASLPFFYTESGKLPDVCQDAYDNLRSYQNDEYRRLLYVALTRAETRLYVGGYYNKKKPSKENWYSYVEDAFATLENVEEISLSEEVPEDVILRYKSLDLEGDNDNVAEEPEVQEEVALSIPEWLFKPMPEEPSPPRPLIPSRPSGPAEEVALSPLRAKENNRFKRGNITHKLLQFLPDIPQSARDETARKFLAQPAHGLSDTMQADILKEILAILTDKNFARIFGGGSLAEVSLTGLIDKVNLVSAQIDRLLITDDEILIVDYKTNRPPPQRAEDVQQIYKNQLQSYAKILRALYPEHKIRTALIWTDGARLMELENKI